MRSLSVLLLPLALFVLGERTSLAQLPPDAGVGDGCCGKVCTKPTGCTSPTRQTSTRCQALVYNAGTDFTQFTGSPTGGGACAQANDPTTPGKILFCIGGGGNSGFAFGGCECVDSSPSGCGFVGASTCTQAAVNGCKAGGGAIYETDDPHCPPC